MFEELKKLEILSVWKGTSPKQRTYSNRFCHCLVFKLSGKSLYDTLDSGSVTVNEGDVLYIPQGCNYRTTMLSQTSGYIAINFYAEFPETPCTLIDFPSSFDAHRWFHSMLQFWVLGEASNIHQCHAMFYSMLSQYDSTHNYQTTHSKMLIKNSVSYLEEHIFDPNIDISYMMACSKISVSYFRQLFLSIYGQSPKQYIKNVRLSQAYTILSSGEYYDIQSVAAQVGYSDALYFSKIFKQKYGVAPSALKHIFNDES